MMGRGDGGGDCLVSSGDEGDDRNEVGGMEWSMDGD